MEIAYIISMIVMSFAVSLGVGCSTVAVTQFFAAIKDGGINEAERKMLGVVYFLLRVAMAGILLTMIAQGAIVYYISGNFLFISPFFMALYTVVGVLFLNAIGMTWRLIPSSLGPAIQASSWYSLGFLMALVPLGLTAFTYTQFLLVYAGVMLITIAALNILMGYLRKD